MVFKTLNRPGAPFANGSDAISPLGPAIARHMVDMSGVANVRFVRAPESVLR